MLKSKSIAKLIENLLNENDKDEKFRVVYEVGSYKGTAINCVFKQGKGSIRPIANYTNVVTPYTLEIIMPTQCGEDRVDLVVDIVNDFILKLNGKVRDIDNGKAVFLINPLEIGSYDARATVGQSALIKVDFTIEYSERKDGIKYELALTNSEWHYGTNNVRLFKKKSDKKKWFDQKISETNAPFAEILSPHIKSLVINQQRYTNPNQTPLNELLMYNYAVIKEIWTDGYEAYYYYYITSSNIDQYNLLSLELKLDTIQTYYTGLSFGDCFISRAHLDRFIDNQDGTVSFNTKIDSPLFEREEFQSPQKILTKRKVLSPFNTGFDKFDNWYNENVLGWIYMYISTGDYIVGTSPGGTNGKYTVNFTNLKYKTFGTNDEYFDSNTYQSSFYNTLQCLAFPVYKQNHEIYITAPEAVKSTFTSLNATRGISQFIKANGSAKIYTLKFSIVPPFDINEIKKHESLISIDAEGDLILSGSVTILNTKRGILKTSVLKNVDIFNNVQLYNDSPALGSPFLNVTKQSNINMESLYTYNDKNYTAIPKSSITDLTKKDINLNPKLYNSDYMSLKISDNTQNGAEYDVLKLGASGKIKIKYTEALTPDITKVYIRCNGDSDKYGIYNNSLQENLTGFVASDDKSLIYENEAFKSMLANNKNFFLQNSVNRGFDIGQGIFGAVSGALQGSFLTGGNPAGAVVGAGVSIAQTITSNIKNQINQDMMVDNLKNAPNSISGALGNVVFNSLYSDTGIVVEIHEILPFEKEIINDQMHMNGFTFNKVDNIKKYDSTRKYFNYIQANIDTIIGLVSEPIKQDIRERFANGVRFWHVDVIGYEQENYERWLENG